MTPRTTSNINGNRRRAWAMCAAMSVLLATSTGFAVAGPARWVEVTPGSANMTYRLTHPLHKIEATSNAVYYKIEVDPAAHAVKSVYAQADVTTYSSGNSSRDSHAMEVIDAIDYPDVKFTSTSVTQNGNDLQVAGKLLFHGVTKDVVITATAVWTEHTVTVSGNFALSLAAFNIERPSLLMIPVEDALAFDFSAAFAL